MPLPDYRGARGANAGDDFHELWALREALSLLDVQAEVTGITVEGFRPTDAAGAAESAWDGVDCGYYYGGTSLATAASVRFDQVKYSSADPGRAWTVARLTSGADAGRRSVLGRLGDAFETIRSSRPDLIDAGRITIRLVSNQPVAPEVVAAVAENPGNNRRTPVNPDRERARRQLEAACRVEPGQRDAFFRALDFSQCGAGSRLGFESGVLATIAGWTESDARPLLDTLMRKVRLLMMPESTDVVITPHLVLTWLGVSDPAALFPCPSALERPGFVVAREAARSVVRAMADGRQRVCLHGSGGVGKTTALLEVADLLPEGSVVVAFDCYGGGRYLDSESPRHRPTEAFLQLSNDLAVRLQLPLLIQSTGTVTAFTKRLGMASAAFAAQRPGALLVIAVDAADNAVYAAAHHAPPEPAFVHELAQVGQLPPNVRLLVSARTGRLASLRLRPDFALIELEGFSPAETVTYARHHWPAAPDAWVEDFHRLSDGNPRVQTYALRMAGADNPAAALEALRPFGKTLDQVFGAQFEEAVRRWGSVEEGRTIARGLIALPRPVPIAHLAAVVGQPAAVVRDFCQDLAPGVRFESETVGFADEDFEAFVRVEAGDVSPLFGRVADRLAAERASDAYAATHLAPALLAAGRRSAVIALANEDDRLAVIRDPVLRRDVRLQRTRIAVRVCRDAGDLADALLTVVHGVSALSTDATLRNTLVEHPGLSTRFAEASVARTVLRQPDAIASHGRLLMHQLAADAARGDGPGVREGQRRISAWLSNRETARRQAEHEPELASPSTEREWPIEDDDIAAAAEALLRTSGPQATVEWLRGWRPRTIPARVALILAPRLAAGGDAQLLTQCLEALDLAPWDLLLRVPLALGGAAFDAARAEASLAHPLCLRLARPGVRGWRSQERDFAAAFRDIVLTACELCVSAGSRSGTLVQMLTRFGRPGAPSPTASGDVHDLDLRLRALGALARLDGRRLDAAQLFPPRPPLDAGATAAERRAAQAAEEQERRVRDLVAPLIPVYDARVRVLLGEVPAADQAQLLVDAVAAGAGESYRSARHYEAAILRTCAARALLALLARPDADPAGIWRQAEALARPSTPGFSEAEASVWLRAAARPELHEALVERATTRAADVAQAQLAATGQIDALCRLASAVLPISPDDAAAIFRMALDASEGVDPDVQPRLSLLASLAPLSAPALDEERRRQLAAQSAVAFEDAAVRLQDYDGFPWRSVVRGLAAWDVPFALAAVGRWDDTQLASRHEVLPEVLMVALDDGVLSPRAVLAFAPLIGRLPPGLRDAVVRTAAIDDVEGRAAVADALAELELLLGDEGAGAEGAAVLRATDALLSGTASGPWARRLREVTREPVLDASCTAATDGGLHGVTAQSGASSGASPDEDTARVSAEASVRWDEYDLTSPEQIARAIADLTHAQPADQPIGLGPTLRTVRSRVSVRNRTRYAAALLAFLDVDSSHSLAASRDLADYAVAHELKEVLEAWGKTAGVRDWMEADLVQGLPGALPALAGTYGWGSRVLPALCRHITGGSGTRRQMLRDALLLGLERHAEAMTPAGIYHVVEVATELADASDVARIAEGLAGKLAERVRPEHRACWDLADLPTSGADAAGRLLYAWLGDPDLRIRWRAAHAGRRLARAGEHAIVGAAVGQYARIDESLFRDPHAPFYWQAARLWLVVALARGAHEAPTAIAPYAAFLVRAGLDDEFPHLLLRSVAREAARALAASGLTVDGAAVIAQEDLVALDVALGTRRPRAERDRNTEPRDLDDRGDARRFHFDVLDTIPYWYAPAVRAFADLDMRAFLDAAERWIVDRWSVRGPVWEWAREPRQHRLDRWEDTSHSQGSRPLVERYSTHLEWQAMWCAAGSLLATHTLTRGRSWPDADPDDELERWIGRAGLSDPPYWAADFREHAPPAKRGLPPAHTSATWLQEVAEADLRDEAGLAAGSGWITVAAEDAIDAWGGYVATSVHTALVSPGTAAALVRALQTVDDAHRFRLPDAGDDFEIRAPKHQLLGWLERRETERGDLDDYDPIRRGAAGRVPNIPDKIVALLGIQFVLDPFPRWANTQTGATVLRYRTWSDEEVRTSRYRRSEPSSRGWRLQITAEALTEVLVARRLDLVMEVGVHRRARGYNYPTGYTSDDPKATEDDARFSRLYLLRADGSFAGAEGPLGTWTAPRPRTGD